MTQYVLLTGSKNNAGDFLIKDRAKDLFSLLKPSVKLIDYDAWEILDESKLKEINNSKALILLGGPALQMHMYPKIYFLENKDSFTDTDWKDLYKLSKNTFVEETDRLKEGAAGAGLTDND